MWSRLQAIPACRDKNITRKRGKRQRLKKQAREIRKNKARTNDWKIKWKKREMMKF